MANLSRESVARRRAQDGGASRPEAFDVSVLVHHERLRRESRRLAASPADSEDLVQDTYARALESSHRFAWGTNLLAWLLTILRNTASNRHRQQRRTRVQVDGERVARSAEALQAPGDTPEEALLAKAVDPQVKAAFEALPRELRAAVWLRDVEELSYADMADVLKIPLGTVRSRIFRGRERLYTELAARVDRNRGDDEAL